MINNILMNTDSYKVSHHKMLPPGCTKMVGNWTARSFKFAPGDINYVISFGQQAVIRWINEEFTNFFNNPNAVEEIKIELDMHLGIDYDVSHFQQLHELKYLPIEFRSLPEGIKVQEKIPLMIWYNTHDDFAWLSLYLETVLSNMLWKPMTSATIAYSYRKNVNEYVKLTDEKSLISDFMVHDFSSRGMGSVQCSMFSGMGFLTSSKGTDSLVAIQGIRHFYEDKGPIAFSVPASEHSCSSACIGVMGEKEMISYYMRQYPKGILSIVADTLDLTKIVKPNGYLDQLKNEIIKRDGKIVIRPDSNPPGLTPVDMICGHNNPLSFRELEADYPEFYKKGLIQCLWDIFGGTTNEQGFKVLSEKCGAIYGEAINLTNQVEMYKRLMEKGFAATNVLLGVGSYTLNMNSRDTLGFAAKATYCEVNKKNINIFKDPMTDGGTKKSAKGLLAVYKKENNEYYLKDQVNWEEVKNCELKVIFENGVFYNQTTLTEIRKNINEIK